jgi:hypothetical protein
MAIVLKYKQIKEGERAVINRPCSAGCFLDYKPAVAVLL